MVSPTELTYSGCALTCAIIAAITDVRERRIPNLLTGPAILFGLLLHLTLGGFAQLGWSLLAGLTAGGIFLLFFIAGGMGAGDVKLIAAIGCISGISSVRELLVATVIIGAVFALGLALARGRMTQLFKNVFQLLGHHSSHGLVEHPELNVRNRSMLRLPYALPIAAGCLTTLILQLSAGRLK